MVGPFSYSPGRKGGGLSQGRPEHVPLTCGILTVPAIYVPLETLQLLADV
jgi:hypothetical protein